MEIIDLKEHVNERTDPRGWMINFIQSDLVPVDAAKNIHLGTITPGSVRGNHYHNNQEEWILVFGGRAEFVWRSGDVVDRRVVEEGDVLLFNIKAGEAHAVKNIDTKDIYLCAIASLAFDKDNMDVVRDNIIE